MGDIALRQMKVIPAGGDCFLLFAVPLEEEGWQEMACVRDGAGDVSSRGVIALCC